MNSWHSSSSRFNEALQAAQDKAEPSKMNFSSVFTRRESPTQRNAAAPHLSAPHGWKQQRKKTANNRRNAEDTELSLGPTL